MAAPTKTELEAERERLRALGWTEEDIRQVLIQREVQRSSPAAANFSAPQMPMAGVLGNASAVLSHARGTIPVVRENFANLADGSAPRRSRAKSGAILAGVAVIVCLLGYAIYQEWQIHIVADPMLKQIELRKNTIPNLTKSDLIAAHNALKQRCVEDRQIFFSDECEKYVKEIAAESTEGAKMAAQFKIYKEANLARIACAAATIGGPLRLEPGNSTVVDDKEKICAEAKAKGREFDALDPYKQ